MRELKSQEEENYKNITDVNNLKEQIAHLQLEIAKEESRKKNMEGKSLSDFNILNFYR